MWVGGIFNDLHEDRMKEYIQKTKCRTTGENIEMVTKLPNNYLRAETKCRNGEETLWF